MKRKGKRDRDRWERFAFNVLASSADGHNAVKRIAAWGRAEYKRGKREGEHVVELVTVPPDPPGYGRRTTKGRKVSHKWKGFQNAAGYGTMCERCYLVVPYPQQLPSGKCQGQAEKKAFTWKDKCKAEERYTR